MTEPSDEQIIADALLLGGEFVCEGCRWFYVPHEPKDMPAGYDWPAKKVGVWSSAAYAAEAFLKRRGYTYIDGKLTKLR